MRFASFDFLKRLSRRDVAIIAGGTVFGGLLYVVVSALVFKVGFPLDDAWIHLTFARTLAEHGEWAFRPGIPAAGSTSPLWSALLSIGFFIGLAPYIWTYLLGLLTLFVLGVLCELTARNMISIYTPRIPWVGIFIVFEWHLLWAAMSGMETLLHALIVTGVLSALMVNSRRFLSLGLLVGLSVWVRPDGLTLLAPLVLAILLTNVDSSSRMRGLTRAFIGFGAVFLFYLLFNLLIGDTPMPNTFYAKQAEYIGWQQQSIFKRLGDLSFQLFTGPFLFLVIGSAVWAVRSVRTRAWGSVLALIWAVGYMLLYILRLPVYQHGRYVMPALPVLFLAGLLAMVEFSHSKKFGRYQWFVNTLWQAGVGVLCVLFLFLGAYTYSQDVAFIEQEMVVSAKWAAENIPEGRIIAAHDIGALGYFDDHPLIDLAGLISPEVIPFMRDQVRLATHLDSQGADYLIAFSDLYEDMTKGREVLFTGGGFVTEQADFAPMTIYRWK